MKKLFTIGNTAELLNVSATTLRYYDEIGLIHPEYTDPNTGYRYYSLGQFHYIDRIKYLREFGLPLAQIKEIIESGSVELLLPYLQEKKKAYKASIKAYREKIKDIDWYIGYFTYMDNLEAKEKYYSIHLEERYFAAVPCYDDEALSANELRLSQLKSSSAFRNLKYLRQWNYIIDYKSLVNHVFKPIYSATRIKERPEFTSSNIVVVPEGDFLCFKARLLADDFGAIHLLDHYLRKLQIVPRLVVACEFEDNLREYTNTPYEVQILI